MKRKLMLACGLVCGAAPGAPMAWAVPVSLTTTGLAYTQNFNTLANAPDNALLDKATSVSPLPMGWDFIETGGDTNYRVGAGTNTAGDTYSFGPAANSDRALGSVTSNTITSIALGAVFTNNTGQTITSLNIAYTGEQWRGGDTAGVVDTLAFSYSDNTSAINAGTFLPFGSLDFSSPQPTLSGPLNGNALANQTSLSQTIAGLSIPNGQSFAIRWTDSNITGSDDGLSVDDFSLTPNGSGGPPPGASFTHKLPQANQKTTIDFTGFTAAGFTPAPAATQLDSDNWRVSGLSDGAMNFGDTQLAGDFARGASTGGVTTGGVYAFNHGGGDVGLGVQPAGSDFVAPGFFELKLPNETGGTINDLAIMYDIWVFNDQARANSLNFSWSTDGTTFNSEPLLDFISGEAAMPLPAWASVQRSVNLTGLGIPNGGFLFLRWSGADVSGSGSRDEFAIDNIMVSSIIPEPATMMLLGLLAPAALRRRSRR